MSIKHQLVLMEIRQAVADYMRSEGCSCCRGKDHEKHANRLGELLSIPKYSDGSGYDFYQYASEKQAKPEASR